MKKLFSVLIVLTAFAVIAYAQQTSLGIAPIDSNLSTSHSLKVSCVRVSGIGPFWVKPQIKIHLDSVWMDGDTSLKGAGTVAFDITIDSLIPNTFYDVRVLAASDSIFTNATTTIKQVGKTKPLPQPVKVTLITVVPFLPNSMVVVSYESIGDTSMMFGLSTPNFSGVTDTVLVIGSGIDTLYILNAPNQLVSAGVPMITSFSSGGSAQGASWNSFRAPNYVRPDVVSLVASVVYIDTAQVKSIVTAGNGGNADIVGVLRDSMGNILQQFPSRSVATSTTDTLVYFIAGNPKGKYSFTLDAITAGIGMDTAKVTFQMLGVPAGTVELDGSAKTRTTIDLDFKIKSNGNWNESTIDSFILKEGGVVIVADAVSILGTVMKTVNLTGKNPGVKYDYTGYIVNRLREKFLISPFSVTTNNPIVAIAPNWGVPVVIDASSIAIESIAYAVASGDVAQLLVMYRKDGSLNWDTIVVAGNLTTGGTLDALITGLLGGTKYWFKIAMKSSDGNIAVNGVEKWEITIAPQNPMIMDIIIDQLTSTSVSGQVIGHGMGTLSSVKTELYKIENDLVTLDQTGASVAVGTGNFTTSYAFNNLISNMTYELRATVTGPQNSNPSASSKYFTTTWSGVEEITEDQFLDKVLMKAWTVNGKQLGSGLRKDLLATIMSQYPNQTILIGPAQADLLARYKAKQYKFAK